MVTLPSVTTPDPAVERRRLGALLGLAIGDALGAAVEFKRPGTFPPVTGYRGGGPHGLGPGEWTDDTSMALALADSLATHGEDLADQGRRYVAWWREGKYSVNGRCFDMASPRARGSRASRRGPTRPCPATLPTPRAAMARSCDSRRSRFTTSQCSPKTRLASPPTPRRRASRPIEARSACRRVVTWQSCSRR